ncbi:MAG: glycine/betaine ABC transporter [Tenericutes bacterium]|jgi:glycine betaine/proline transport system substrate-binding protein|nr:glycine/betaine ABC transporter [Mycoplasmatota bacterium]
MKKLFALLLTLTLVFTVAACTDTSDDPVIVGIDPGAGIMAATNDAIDVYGLNYELEASSGPVMMTQLAQAYENEEFIVVTGWKPHYMFADYDLKFLEDPEGVFGGVENLHTIARLDIRDDFPDVTTFLENFYMSSSELGSLMGDINEFGDDMTNLEIARQWMSSNEALYQSWLPEGIDGTDKTFDLYYVNWAEGVAMTNLVAAILEDEGFTVTMTEADPGIVFTTIAQGDADAFLDGWLPVTHGSYEEQYGDQYLDLGYNFEGARIGLVVPSYVEIDSISELNDLLE